MLGCHAATSSFGGRPSRYHGIEVHQRITREVQTCLFSSCPSPLHLYIPPNPSCQENRRLPLPSFFAFSLSFGAFSFLFSICVIVSHPGGPVDTSKRAQNLQGFYSLHHVREKILSTTRYPVTQDVILPHRTSRQADMQACLKTWGCLARNGQWRKRGETSLDSYIH